VKVNCKWGLGW